jgi:transposase
MERKKVIAMIGRKMASLERYELTDDEWSAIRPMLPNKPRGVSRANDRRVLNDAPILAVGATGI